MNVLIALIGTCGIKNAQTQTRTTGDMFGTSKLQKVLSLAKMPPSNGEGEGGAKKLGLRVNCVTALSVPLNGL